MMKSNTHRDSRSFLRYEPYALILFALAPMALGCIKLRTLDCASSPEGCQDLKPDARRADVPVAPPDAHVDEPASGPADLPTHMDVPEDGPQDSVNPTDQASGAGDAGWMDTTRDLAALPQDVATMDVPSKDGGMDADAGRPDTMDATPDTARTPDTRTPDLAPLPDVGAIYTVTFNAGVAKGAMSGYGWVTMGALDVVSSPTCGASYETITAANTCVSTSTNWDSNNALCVSGTIPALPPSPTSTDYADNWGLQVGANASDPIGALGKTYSTITLNFTGSPQTGLRATVHRTGDAIGTTYCALVTSGTPMVLTSFNTSCWNSSGTNLTAADLPKIDKVGLEVVSSQSEITVSKLCLTSIEFGI
jgi:hypothetical protein